MEELKRELLNSFLDLQKKVFDILKSKSNKKNAYNIGMIRDNLDDLNEYIDELKSVKYNEKIFDNKINEYYDEKNELYQMITLKILYDISNNKFDDN